MTSLFYLILAISSMTSLFYLVLAIIFMNVIIKKILLQWTKICKINPKVLIIYYCKKMRKMQDWIYTLNSSWFQNIKLVGVVCSFLVLG